MRFEALDWYDVQDICEIIGVRLKDEYDAVVGVSRGGLIPARIIADIIGVSRFASLSANHYSHETYGRYKDVYVADVAVAKDIKHILVVDDIYDTGKTLKKIAQMFKKKKVKVTFVTLHSKKKLTKVEGCNFYYGKIAKNWVVYPWESQELNRVLGK